MGRASSNKKNVSRASKVAGRTSSRSSNLVWPAAVAAVVLLGILLVAVSRGGGNDASVAPVINQDHWHAAYGIYDCDTFRPPLKDLGEDVHGIHTHQDGLVHIHPFDTSASGKNATLAVFATDTGMKLTDTWVTTPGFSRKNGDKCGGKPGTVQLWTWDSPSDTTGTQIKTDLAKYRPQNQSVLTIAFVPAGTVVPQPPSAQNLQDPVAAEEGRPTPADVSGSTTSTVPVGTSSTTATTVK
jgi:hypothetical protein